MSSAKPDMPPEGNREPTVRRGSRHVPEPTPASQNSATPPETGRGFKNPIRTGWLAKDATLQAIGDIAPLGIFVNDRNGVPLYVNAALLEIIGQSGRQAVSRWPESIALEDRERVKQEWADCVASGQTHRGCRRIVKPDGEEIVAEIVSAPVLDWHGRVTRVTGTVQNITAQRRAAEAELALRRSEQRYRLMVDTAQEGVWLRDANALTVFVNRRMCEMLGYTADEMIGKPVYDFMSPDARADAERRFARRQKGESQQHDVCYKHKNGADVWTIVSGSPMYDDDGEFIGAMGMVTNITERKRQEETIRWQAFHDELTGLPNRSLLEERLGQLIAVSERQNLHVAVMFIDLDRFKQVNDSLGHDFGDRLLKIVADRIAGCLRQEDTIARMGGDEFTALLPGIENEEAVFAVAGKILAVLADPVDLGEHEVYVSGSIGVSLHPVDGNDVQSLLKHADVAMYRSKEQGGNACCLYTPSMGEVAIDNLHMESALRKALPRGEFFLAYQPQVDLETGGMRTVEALCRWRHAEMGIIPPQDFIPLAEDTGVIFALGEWVLREACRQARSWHDAGRPLRVSVNLSARQLAQPGLADLVRSVLAETGLGPEWLELELTENAIMKNTESVVDVLGGLRDLGVRLTLDDFGTGYSSLSYLRQFRFDVLKIDHSFVASIVDDEVNQAVVQAIIDLSRSLKLEVVAEGVETVDQRRALQALGCRTAQGYLFSPPVSADAIRDDKRHG